MTGWEDMSRTPTTTNESATQGGEVQNDRETETPEVPSGGSSTPETPALDRAPFGKPRVHTSNGDTPFVTYPTQSISPVPDPPTSSATPDPASSLDDYASQSSPSSSSLKHLLERSSLRTPGTMILERLDELLLGHGHVVSRPCPC